VTRGAFIVLEGLDGVGKSTQARRLKTRLEALGLAVVHTREPGGTLLGERVRSLLLDPSLGETVPVADVFLYQACRAQLVEELIRPAIERGNVVICERWHWSTLAYQGVAGRAGAEAVRVTSALATAGVEPDRAVLLDLPDQLASARIGRLLDRIEGRGAEYRQRGGEAFRASFREDPARLRVVSASGSPEQVETRVWDAVADLFPEESR
jgi:dTMP kinase